MQFQLQEDSKLEYQVTVGSIINATGITIGGIEKGSLTSTSIPAV